MLLMAQVLKEKWFKNHGFCSFTNNKLVNEAVNDSAWVSGQDRKNRPLSEVIRIWRIPPARKLRKK